MKVSQAFTNPVVYGVVFLSLLPMMTQAATHVVTEGQSIADALAISAPGDSVLVGAGEYHQSGLEMPNGITLAALSQEPDEYPRLIGENAETILHCENLSADTRIEGLIFVGGIPASENGPARGHGIHAVNSAVIIADCSFQGLKASYGGAIYIGEGIAPSIISCSFESNSAIASGGAVSLVAGQGLLLDHCLFVDNTADAGGSALNIALQASAIVGNCTFVANGVSGMGDIQAWDSELLEVSNCIVANGNGRPFYGDFSSTPQLHCSDLTGSADGDWIGALSSQAETNGNISLPPMFCAEAGEVGPYSLNEDSPCTAEANPGCGIMGAFEIGCDSSTGMEESDHIQVTKNNLPTVTQLRGNYPNPFNPQTTIAFDLSQPGHTAVDVYDLAGRLVRNLHSGVLAAGPHEVMWNGRGPDGRMSAAGVYFFRLKTEQVIDTRRMTLVK